jgi:hypothetical protein
MGLPLRLLSITLSVALTLGALTIPVELVNLPVSGTNWNLLNINVIHLQVM